MLHNPLFSSSTNRETILIPGAEIYYDKNFLSPEEATTLFNLLRRKCAWERRKSSFQYAVPRDEAYYGDPGTNYTYSRREYKPLAWISELLSLRALVEEATPAVAYANLSLPKLGYNAVDKVITPDVILHPHNGSLELTFYDGKQFPAECRSIREIFSPPSTDRGTDRCAWATN